MKRIFFCILLCVSVVNTALGLDAIEIFTGFLDSELDGQHNYEIIPLFLSFNFDAKPAFSKIEFNPKSSLNFIVEPFINTVVQPDVNIEAGTNFLIKYAYPLTDNFQSYLKMGVGVVYMTQHTKEQSTQLNFLPQAGIGFHYFIKENVAVSCEYRARHLSNCSLNQPNKGIDSKLFLAGIALFFK